MATRRMIRGASTLAFKYFRVENYTIVSGVAYLACDAHCAPGSVRTVFDKAAQETWFTLQLDSHNRRAQRSASQYQVKIHSTATARSSRYGAITRRKDSGSARRSLWTTMVPVASRMPTYIERACRSIPQ